MTGRNKEVGWSGGEGLVRVWFEGQVRSSRTRESADVRFLCYAMVRGKDLKKTKVNHKSWVNSRQQHTYVYAYVRTHNPQPMPVYTSTGGKCQTSVGLN